MKSRSVRVALLAGLVTFLAVTSSATAATLAEYRARVSEAANAMRGLTAPVQPADDSAQREALIENILVRVSTLLPAKETVSVSGQNVEVDNGWLHEQLTEYERIKHHRSRSEELFRRTAERLEALLERLNESKDAASGSEKDENKARLAEILRRPEYDKTVAQGSAIERLWNRFIDWLSRLFPKTKGISPGTGQALSVIAQAIVIVLGLALIVFLIWTFLPRFLQSRGRKKKTKREARIVLGERLEPDQTAADLLEQAEALARAGDLRGAIRKAYIALLCELGDSKVISLAQHKTNRDYLMSVRHKPSLYQTMRKLTASFELHWYGFVSPAPNDWTEFSAGCRNAVDIRQA